MWTLCPGLTFDCKRHDNTLWLPLGLSLRLCFYSIYHKSSCLCCQSSKQIYSCHPYTEITSLVTSQRLQCNCIVFKLFNFRFSLCRWFCSSYHCNISLVHKFTLLALALYYAHPALIISLFQNLQKLGANEALLHAGPVLWNNLPIQSL